MRQTRGRREAEAAAEARRRGAGLEETREREDIFMGERADEGDTISASIHPIRSIPRLLRSTPFLTRDTRETHHQARPAGKGGPPVMHSKH